MPSRSYQTTGIVVGRSDFGEADRIIRLITPEYGKIAVIAKGVRRIKSRAAGHLEPLGETSLTLARGRGSLDVVTAAKLLWYPHRLTGDFRALKSAFAFAALSNRIAAERQSQPELYDNLREALSVLDAIGPSPLAELWFKLRALQLSGLRPELSACLSCDSNAASSGTTSIATADDYFFDPSLGGLICSACRHDGLSPIDARTVKLWRLLADHSFAVAARISDGPALAEKSIILCDRFYEYHIGKKY